MSGSPGPERRVRGLGLQSYLSGMVAASLLLAGVTLAGVGYYLTNRTIEASAKERIDVMARSVLRETESEIRLGIRPFLETFASGPVPKARTLEERLSHLPLLQAALRGRPMLDAVFVGRDNGDFFSVKNTVSDEDRALYGAPAETALVVRLARAEFSPSQAERLFYDSDLRLLERRLYPESHGYDPRARPWYLDAVRSGRMIETAPQLMYGTDLAGILFTLPSRDGQAAVGASVQLDQYSRLLLRERPTPGSRLAVFRADGSPVANARGMVGGPEDRRRIRTPEDFHPVLREGVAAHRRGMRNGDMRVRLDGADWFVAVEELDLTDPRGDFLVLAIPRDELFAHADRFVRESFLVLLGILFLSVPAVVYAAQRLVRPLRMLVDQAENPHGPGNGEPAPHSGVKEIDSLALGVDRLREHYRKILSLLRLVGNERDMARLRRNILRESVLVSGVDGGAMVGMDEEGRFEPEGHYYWQGAPVLNTNRSEADPRGLSRMEDGFRRSREKGGIVLERFSRSDPSAAGSPTLSAAFADPEVVGVEVAWMALTGRTGSPLGLLAFLRRLKPGTAGFTADQAAFCESLAAAAAIALETQRMIKGQRDLRDAFLHILADAIDAKSPYTGAHCKRVPVLFQMLLEAACAETSGPLADFALTSDGWEEAHLAAWLHDCGKVTTPEYVVDKATKLETLCDRIHEIRMRFEVLKRDAEIDSLSAVLAGANPEEERRRLAEAVAALDGEFAFVARMNIGDESVEEEDLARLAAIGRRTWTRTLDKTRGVSRDERARMERAGTPPPPAVEPLLADQPEHRIPRGEKDRLSPDNPWGFKAMPPEALYDRGELHNLSIRHGTLTEEERHKIDDHIARTIMMLERIPLPKELRQMPQIAGAHHERMDGTGYPRRLRGEEMGWSARMLAIADIFEALTAPDRPYKAGKSLDEALAIMERFVADGHIDPVLYELFLRAGIPQRYTEEYLFPPPAGK